MAGTKASRCGRRARYATGAHLLQPRWQAGLLSVFAAKKLRLKRTGSNGRQIIHKRGDKYAVSSILRDGRVKNPSQELCRCELGQELATKLSPSILSLASFDEEFTKDISAPEFTIDEPTLALTEDEYKHLTILYPWPSDEFTKEVNDILRSDGYPLPAYDDDGMYLKGSFEDEFGTHMWRKRTRKVALMKSKSVVALASFNDKERHFACTGVFLDCNESTSTVLTSASLVRTSGEENKIVDNLRIEACFLKEKHIIGTLLHYDLSYNVAVVSIPIFSENHAAISVESTQTRVVALGRAFKSGNLMATDGLVIGEQDKFDCRELKFSTCKITKAGIGGPLYDLKGNFVGMNFYDTEGTPYLPSNIIMKLLESFDAEWAISAEITEKPNYSWPVPKPYWYYPSQHEQKLEPKRMLE